MNGTGIGDLSQSHMLQRRNLDIRREMLRLTDELATGQVADVRKVLDGNYSQLTNIARSLETLDGYNVVTTEVGLFASGIQESLGRIADLGTALSTQMLVAGISTSGAVGADMAAEARQTLDGMVSAINAQQAGRNLFGGTATDRAPLATSEDLLAELQLAMAGAATPDDMLLAADAWFDDPAGFTAMIYQGAADDLTPFALSETDTVDLALRADDPLLRNALRDVAVAALADDPAFGLTVGDQSELFSKSATRMLSGRDGVISLQSRIGFSEARIETVTARNAAERTSLEMTRNGLVGVDPFQTATELEGVQFQLQSLYSVTVRLSQLSLVNFI